MFTCNFYTHRFQKCKNSVKSLEFFTLLVSVRVKAVCEMLVKLITEVNFINILCDASKHADPKSAKDTDDLTEFLHFWNLCTLKLVVKSWSDWHLITRVLRRAVDHPGVDVDIETGSGMDEEWKAQKTKQKEVVAA